MRLHLRIVLLVGCGLVASLEAPEAGAWLWEGISGAYAAPDEQALPATAPAARLHAGLPLDPLPFPLAPFGLAAQATLAVGR